MPPKQPDAEAWKLRIHTNSGAAIDTLVTTDELEHNNAQNIDQLVESFLNPTGKPRWITLGTVKFHPQAISAIEIEEL